MKFYDRIIAPLLKFSNSKRMGICETKTKKPNQQKPEVRAKSQEHPPKNGIQDKFYDQNNKSNRPKTIRPNINMQQGGREKSTIIEQIPDVESSNNLQHRSSIQRKSTSNDIFESHSNSQLIQKSQTTNNSIRTRRSITENPKNNFSKPIN